MYNKIKQYLFNNGIDLDLVMDKVEIKDNSDGKGPFISVWKLDIKKPTKTLLNSLEIDGNINYKVDRKRLYPSVEEQLDKIFHEGLGSWEAEIQAIKDKFPKPE